MRKFQETTTTFLHFKIVYAVKNHKWRSAVSVDQKIDGYTHNQKIAFKKPACVNCLDNRRPIKL